jgi:hypothetical protein
MGRAARQEMIERYSHDANYPKFKAMVDIVAGHDRANPRNGTQ